MTIRIEIPSGIEHLPLAAAIGQALLSYGGGVAPVAAQPEAHKALTTKDVVDSIKETKAEAQAEVERIVNLELAAENTTDTTQSSTLNPEQSNAKPDAGAAEDATAAKREVTNDVIVAGAKLSDNDPDNLDEKGVGFNAAMCGKAAKPFYGSGKTKGQWKKRQGVETADYDQWYRLSLEQVSNGGGEQEQEQIDSSTAFTPNDQGDNVTPIDTANAFAGKQNGQVIDDGQNHQPQGAGGLTFADAGAFMQWLSEQQAANLLTAGDIDSAYQATSSTMGDLFDPSKAANAIAQVYNFLANIAEGEK